MTDATPLGPRLETERLILRPPVQADFPRWAEFLGDMEATRHIGGVQSPPTAWRSMAAMTGAWSLLGFSMFSVIEKARAVGSAGWALGPEGWPGTEVGWGLHPDAQGRGYAAEGSAAAIDWAFEALGWTEVIHTIGPENHASARLAERLGSVNRGRGRLPAPFEHLDVDIWGQSRESWLARPGRRT